MEDWNNEDEDDIVNRIKTPVIKMVILNTTKSILSLKTIPVVQTTIVIMTTMTVICILTRIRGPS